MLNPILEFLAILTATCLFVEWAESIQFIKRLFNIGAESEPKYPPVKVIKAAANCCLCTGFWAGFIYYSCIDGLSIDSFWLGCLTSIGSELWNRFVEYLFWKLGVRK